MALSRPRTTLSAAGFGAVILFGLFAYKFNDWRKDRLPDVRVDGDVADRVSERADQLEMWKWGGILTAAGGIGCFFFALPIIRLKESLEKLSPIEGTTLEELREELGEPNEVENLDNGEQRLTWKASTFEVALRIENGKCARVERTREG